MPRYRRWRKGDVPPFVRPPSMRPATSSTARKGYKAREELNAAAGRAEILNDGLDPRSFEPDGTLGENEALAYAFRPSSAVQPPLTSRRSTTSW